MAKVKEEYKYLQIAEGADKNRYEDEDEAKSKKIKRRKERLR